MMDVSAEPNAVHIGGGKSLINFLLGKRNEWEQRNKLCFANYGIPFKFTGPKGGTFVLIVTPANCALELVLGITPHEPSKVVVFDKSVLQDLSEILKEYEGEVSVEVKE
jgi:hypothetical protein